MYNYVIDDCLGTKECRVFCKLKRYINKKRYNYYIAPTIIINESSDTTYFLYFNNIEYGISSPDNFDKVDKGKIDNLIDSISHNRALAVIDSSSVKNNRRNWIIVYNYEELKTVCELFVSEIEKDENDEFALIYAVLNIGPLAEKGIIYVFKKEEHIWKMILKRIPWVS